MDQRGARRERWRDWKRELDGARGQAGTGGLHAVYANGVECGISDGVDVGHVSAVPWWMDDWGKHAGFDERRGKAGEPDGSVVERCQGAERSRRKQHSVDGVDERDIFWARAGARGRERGSAIGTNGVRADWMDV